jgi:flagellar basal-body rod protein FlgB
MPVDKLFNTTIDLLGKSIDMRARNHNHLSANVANAETPGYTPQRLSFEGELKEALQDKKKGVPAQPANPRHIPIKGSTAKLEAVQGRVIETPAATMGRDGNRVELENEMAQMAENQIMYNASIQILAKKFEGIKSAIKGTN